VIDIKLQIDEFKQAVDVAQMDTAQMKNALYENVKPAVDNLV